VGLASFKLRYGRTLVSFGPGSVESLASWLSRFKRVYVVAGRSAARVSGALDDVEKYLRTSGLFSVFIIIYSIRIHWCLRSLSTVMCADAVYSPSRIFISSLPYKLIGASGFPRPVGR
jgi:hypothetical protein